MTSASPDISAKGSLSESIHDRSMSRGVKSCIRWRFGCGITGATNPKLHNPKAATLPIIPGGATSVFGTTRMSGEIHNGAAIRGRADILRALTARCRVYGYTA